MTFIRVFLFRQVLPSLKMSGEYRSSGESLGSSTYIWCRAVCYNETVFPTPQTYDPERFLKNKKLNGSIDDPETRIFGSGRRYALAPLPGDNCSLTRRRARS